MSEFNPFLKKPSNTSNKRFKFDTNPADSANDVDASDVTDEKKTYDSPQISSRWGSIKSDIIEEEERRESGNSFQRSNFRRDSDRNDGISKIRSRENVPGTMVLPLRNLLESGSNNTGKYQVQRKSYFGNKSKPKVKKQKEFNLANEQMDFPTLG
tara:strand:- start:304 stop:768 length:465 start_codon:yes stop_codon:yes gene_type:complete